MALKILFDANHNPIPPTILLANRRGNCYGMLSNYYALNVEDCFNDIPTVNFKISKYDNGKVFKLWDKVKDFKLIYCLEWDMWFEITVELDDSDETIKSISATGLAQSELSNYRIYGIEINTENDIARDDYEIPTTLYNPTKPESSLLNRIMIDKASHYRIAHVDDSIKDIQRTFSFDNTSIKDALDEIAQEIGCLVVYGNGNDKLENEHSCPERTISLYDLKKVCKNCGTRYDTYSSCPKCGSTDCIPGYGHDTPILVSKDNLTSEVIYSADTDSMKNCFHLVAGDDLMTATIRNCNPNGTAYIFQISDEDKLDMPTELVEKLNSYNESYDYYYYEYQSTLSSELVQDYNTLVTKYQEYDSEIPTLPETFIGYAQLMENVYNVIDFDSYLTTSLMPTYHMQDTTAEIEVSKLTQANLSPVGVSNIKSISSATADSYVLEIAKIVVDSRYRVKINTSSFNKDSLVWTGNFIVTNYSDEDDTATSNSVNVIVSDDYERFIKQKIDKVFSKNDTEDYSISSVMKMSLGVDGDTFSGEFVEALKRYSLTMLKTMLDCCQGCISVLTEQGIGNAELWKDSTPDMYTKFYLQYYNKSRAIESEISVRQDEISIIEKVMDSIDTEREFIRNELNFEKYLGIDLWKTFCAYRRDDEYNNNNYISDGLSNKELFQNAIAFIEEANKELYKSATLQHNITSTLKNILAVKEFSPLVDYFEVGNWIRIEVDGIIYKLRLLKYSIDFDNFTEINVTFSDVEKYKDCATDVKSVLDQANSMNRTYNYVSKQSAKGDEALRQIEGWQKDSLAMTDIKLINDVDNQDILWDSHGMVFRKFDSITGEYDPNLIRIINSTISISTDGGKTTRTAIGNFLYKDPLTEEIVKTCGVNGETIIGKVVLGEQLGIYNNGGTLRFDKNGLMITNEKNTVIINPNDSSVFTLIDKNDTKVASINEDGSLDLTGHITAKSLSTGSKTDASSHGNGLYIDENGNLYSGGNNQTQIMSDGTFSFGNGNMIYDGTTLSFSSDVTLAWTQITGTDDIPNTSQVTTIAKNEISTATIKAGQVKTGIIKSTDEVSTIINLDDGTFTLGNGKIIYNGSTLKFSSDVTLAWGQITGTGNVAMIDDIPTEGQITQITKNTITTSYVNALNVTAASVKSSWVYAGNISANQIYSGSITSTDSSTTIINLSDGTFSFGNGNLTYNGSTLAITANITANAGSIGGMSIFNKHIGTGEAGLSCDGTKEDGNTSGWELWAYGGAFRVADSGITYITTLNNSYSTMTVGGTVTFTGTVDMSGATVKLPSGTGSGSDSPGAAVGGDIDATSIIVAADPETYRTTSGISSGQIVTEGGIKAGTWLSASTSLQIGEKFYVYSNANDGVKVTGKLVVGGGITTSSGVDYVTTSTLSSYATKTYVDNAVSDIETGSGLTESGVKNLLSSGVPKVSTNSLAVYDGYFAVQSGSTTTVSISPAGTITCVSLNQTSDERLKNIIDGFDINYKDLFMKIKPIAFTWKDKNIDTKIHFGIGAQSTKETLDAYGIDSSKMGMIVHEYFKESSLQTCLSDQYYVNYNEIHMLTIPVVQEHEREIIELKNQILLLQGELSILKQKMEEIQNA